MGTVTNRLGGLARRLGLGVLLYRCYHAPLGWLRRCRREGAVNLWRNYRGRRRMERAVPRLPAVGAPDPVAPEVHFLTGKKYWYQTCFCAYSLMRHAGAPLRLVVYDDGSLTDAHRRQMTRLFPGVRFIPRGEIEKRLDQALPRSRYPTLRDRRLVYPHLRKLTDVHAGLSGWKLVLDSDMLFFRRPTFLLDWLRAPDRPCHMLDFASAYGYSFALMEELAGARIPERLNVGVCGLRGTDIDWDRLEVWCRTLLEREGSSYYQEQALTAMLVAGRPCAVAPAADYLINPTRADVVPPRGVMHHYVADSKAWYFRYAWREVLGPGNEQEGTA